MVVDDDEFFLESVSTNLADAGYRTDSFLGGAEAIRHLSAGAGPDLVLLDWKMPGISGIEVMQRLRAEKIETPIIFLTVLSDQIYEEAGLLGGAVDFVEKSRSFAILLRRIAWGNRPPDRRRHSIRLGTYTHDHALVRVHPGLDQTFVPRYFVAFVVFHELLHHVLPPVRRGGRVLYHTTGFRERERAHPDYERSMQWERDHIDRLLRKGGSAVR